MSLDFPYYEELRRKKHPAAKWWRLGDALYYAGLLSAFFAALTSIVISLFVLSGNSTWFWIWPALVVFGGGVITFFVGCFLKQHSYAMSEKAGISIRDF